MLSRTRMRVFSWTLLLLVSFTTFAEARHRQRDRGATVRQRTSLPMKSQIAGRHATTATKMHMLVAQNESPRTSLVTRKPRRRWRVMAAAPEGRDARGR